MGTLTSSSNPFACRYALTASGWPGAANTVLYFIVEDLDVTWNEGVPEITDCSSVDIVAVV